MEIQFLKWKLKIQFSIFNFLKRKYSSSNPIFNKKFEIQFTLNMKMKISSWKHLVIELTTSINQKIYYSFFFIVFVVRLISNMLMLLT